MNKILVATGNKKKAEEISEILGREVECIKLDLPEVQSLSVFEVAERKAKDAYALVNTPIIVDDTGMSIQALNGLPGALVSWFLDSVGNEGVLRLLGDETNRSATVSTAIGYCDETGAHVFLGEVEGKVCYSEKGQEGFGYDPIFVPSGHKKTFAEMSPVEKNETSMRSIALGKLKAFLNETTS
jgi:non-canonical purine NTP pyrophosphatase (RdgB/HAM1 family)